MLNWHLTACFWPLDRWMGEGEPLITGSLLAFCLLCLLCFCGNIRLSSIFRSGTGAAPLHLSGSRIVADSRIARIKPHSLRLAKSFPPVASSALPRPQSAFISGYFSSCPSSNPTNPDSDDVAFHPRNPRHPFHPRSPLPSASQSQAGRVAYVFAGGVDGEMREKQNVATLGL